MKLGILTFHSQLNYGGILQCWALKAALENMGHDVVVIDRQMPHEPSVRSYRAAFGRISRKGKAMFPLRLLLGSSVAMRILRHLRTVRFFRRRIRLVGNGFDKWANFRGRLDCDGIVVGSDQVWNGIWQDPGPYLLEGAPDVPATGYAISLGMRALPDARIRQYEAAVSRFVDVSVREKEAAGLLRTVGFAPEHVVDPTLLVDRSAWTLLGARKRHRAGRIVLLYIVKERIEPYLPALMDFANANGCRVEVIIDGRKNSPRLYRFGKVGANVKVNIEAGPEEFVRSFAKATDVVTDSFHAVMFSTIFGANVRVMRPAEAEKAQMFARIEEFARDNIVGNVVVDGLLAGLDSIVRDPVVSYREDNLARRRDASMAWLRAALGKMEAARAGQADNPRQDQAAAL